MKQTKIKQKLTQTQDRGQRGITGKSVTMGSSDEWRLLLSETERHMVLMHGGRNGCKGGNGETVREREKKKNK